MAFFLVAANKPVPAAAESLKNDLLEKSMELTSFGRQLGLPALFYELLIFLVEKTIALLENKNSGKYTRFTNDNQYH